MNFYTLLRLFLVLRIRPCVGLSSFYVLRHGETDANSAGIIQGSCDLSRLTDKGRSEAAAIGSIALNPTLNKHIKRIDQIYVSPLTRARDTLDVVKRHAPFYMLPPESSASTSSTIIMPDLREIDFYSWEYQTKDELLRLYPEGYAAWKRGDPDGVIVDGRQPLYEIWSRADQVWKEIRGCLQKTASSNTGGDDDATAKLLVCHGTLGQALLGSAFGMDATTFRRNEFPNCGMAEIVWHHDEDFASAWRWHYPVPTEFGCLREQLVWGASIERST